MSRLDRSPVLGALRDSRGPQGDVGTPVALSVPVLRGLVIPAVTVIASGATSRALHCSDHLTDGR
ncbi:MAG: hypothetical protein NTW76_07370 [Corynebacteriales bacterium]|nr:hypothetical protein [Mycobacteriales bacterium]